MVTRWLCALVAIASCTASCGPKPAETTKPVSAGVSPTAIEFRDLAGTPHRLDELAGRVVLLDFWATWCAPCLESLPVYEDWQKRLGPEGLIVVAVSVDKERLPVEVFLRKHAPSLTAFHDPQFKAVSAVNVPKMPTAFLIARDGTVVLREEGFDPKKKDVLESRIRELLAQPRSK